MRIGIITAVEPLGGGLHRILADGIATALVAMGHQVECALLPFSTTTDVLEQAWAFRTLSLCEAFDRVVTLCPPAHLVVHPHKVALLSSHPAYGAGCADAVGQRLVAADRTALWAAERVFATSVAAAGRWLGRTGVHATVLTPPRPDALAVGNGVVSGPDTFTAVHAGPATRGCHLPALLDALRHVSPAVRVHLGGAADNPLLANELGLLAARLRPGRCTMDGTHPSGHAHICLAEDDDIALPAMDRAAAAGRMAVVNRDCAAAFERVEAGAGAVAVGLDDPQGFAAILDQIATEPAWTAWLGGVALDSLAARPTWADVARAVISA